MSDRARDLAEKIWITKGARFNAYRRLNAKHHLSLTSTALMSVYVVFLHLGPALVPTETIRLDPGALTLLTAFLAIAILVLSLLEHVRSYQLRAERLHQCGQALNELYDRLENRRRSETGTPPPLLDEISEEYHRILKSIPENHDPIDNDLFRAQHRHHFGICILKTLGFRVKHTVFTYVLAWAFIIGFPILAVIWLL